MKINKNNLKKLIENYLFERKAKLSNSYAIVCYSDSDFAGKAASAVLKQFGVKVERDKNRNPKGWITGALPQGHAWMILVDRDGKACICEFGSTSCEWKQSKDFIDDAMIWLAKKGVPFLSKCQVRKQWLNGVEGDRLTEFEVKRLVEESLNTARTSNFKVYKGIDFQKAYSHAGDNGECRLYNLMPFDAIPDVITVPAKWAGYNLQSLQFQNCGSYISEIISAGMGMILSADLVKGFVMPGTILTMFDKLVPAKHKTKLVNGEYV